MTFGPAAAHAALPDGRVYEQVSPVDKSGNEAGAQYGLATYSTSSADGSAITYGVTGPTGDVVRGLGFFGTAERTAEGWRTRGTIPGPAAGTDVDTVAQKPTGFISGDARHYVFTASGTFGPPNPAGPIDASAGVYLGGPDTPIKWLTEPQTAAATPRPGALTPGQNSMAVAGGSPDLSTAYFTYCGTLTEEDAPRNLGQTTQGFYEYRDGAVRNAGVLPDGTIDPGGAAAAGESIRCGEGLAGFQDPMRPTNQVSADGERAFFVSPAPAYSGTPDTSVHQLYVRADGRSRLVSHANGEATATPAGVLSFKDDGGANSGAVRYAVANADGTYLAFRSTDVLTDDAPSDATPKTYLYDVARDSVQFVAGVSSDVRFVGSDGSVVNATESGLSVWRDGSVSAVASFAGATDDGAVEQLRANADATRLVFASNVALDPSHPDAGGTPQVYRWAAGDAAPTCLSCRDGDPTQFSVMSSFTPPGSLFVAIDGPIQPFRDARGTTADLSEVFFQTSAALVDEDTNGVNDVYSWKDGRVRLISSGTGTSPSYYLDNSASGDDVFFATKDGLDPEDTDSSYDVYDARVGGGFPPREQRTPCAGDECQPATSGPPALPPVGSGAPGAGNVQPRPSAPRAHGRVRASEATVRRGRVKLRIVAPGAGRLTVRGSGLKTLRRTVKKAGRYAVTVRLTSQARRTVAKTGRRRVRVKVSFRPSSGRSSTTSLVVTVRK